MTGGDVTSYFHRGGKLGLADVDWGEITGGPVDVTGLSDQLTAMLPMSVADRMTADEFLSPLRLADEKHEELIAGQVVVRPRETAGDARAKIAVLDALRAASDLSGLRCEVFVRGMAVRIDNTNVYLPDLILRCGEYLDGDCIEIADPVVVVDINSLSSSWRDTSSRLEDYFRLPSVRHYLIIENSNRTLIHHSREDAGALRTRIRRHGTLELQPPGLSLEVASLFPHEPQ